MRNLKFRVWDESKGEYLSQPDSYSDSYTFGDIDEELTVYHRSCEQVLHKQKGIIQQFTGFLGVGGKEIFEGDYVIYDDGDIYRVDWDETHGWWVFWEQEAADCSTCISATEIHPAYLEVVGNLFEGIDKKRINEILKEIEDVD